MANNYNYGSGWSSRRPIPTVEGYLNEHPELASPPPPQQQQQQQASTPGVDDALGLSPIRSSGSESPQLPLPLADGASGSVKSAAERTGTSPAAHPGAETLPREQKPGEAPPGDVDAQAREKEHLLQAAGPQQKPAAFQARGARVVTDPITHADVVITDASPHAVVDPQMLSSLHGEGFSTRVLPRRKLKKHDELYTSVYPAQPSNALLYPFPPHPGPDVHEADKATRALFSKLVKACSIALIVVWILTVVLDVRPKAHTTWLRVWFRFTYRTAILVALSFVMRSALYLAADRIESDLEQVRARMYQARGTRYPPPVPESAEWLNNFITTLWRQLDPQQFLPIADSIEETIKPMLPSFIAGVKFDDLGFGLRPPQVVSVRGLADLMTDPNYPRESWMNVGFGPHQQQSRSQTSQAKTPPGAGSSAGSEQIPRTASPRPMSPSGGSSVPANGAQGNAAGRSESSGDRSIQPRSSQTEEPPRENLREENPDKLERDGDEDGSDLSDIDGDGISDDEESGDFLNYEIALAYDALDHGRWTESSAGMYTGASTHTHLVVNVLLAVLGKTICLPIWIAAEQLTLTMRVRAQLISEPPYMRNVSVALLGTPMVSASVRPFSSWCPNLLDLPFVHRFFMSTLASVCEPYLVPKAITLNLAEIMAGEGVRKETDAVGVVAVQIIAADGLSSQDANGYSDPYIIISLAKFGRPLYSTRIIFKDLNPVWNETAFVLITKDDIMAEEKISLQLWDSDMHTADDIVGRAAKNVIDLMETPNQFIEYTEGLMSFEDADSMAGRLTYRIGFFELAQFSRRQRNKAVQLRIKQARRRAREQGRRKGKPTEEIKKDKEEAKTRVLRHCREEEDRSRIAANDKTGSNAEIIAQAAALEARAPEPARENTNVFGNRTADPGLDATNSPPDPDWPSGVLRIGVENIEGLELRSGQRDGGVGGEERLPSSYCEVIVDGEVIHTTRVRQFTNMPFFDAAVEVFIRDWTQSEVVICVRDAVVRAYDPIIGVVRLNLPELLTKSSQLSQRFQIEHGAGIGKASINLLFRSVQLRLPRVLMGAQTATLEILSPITIDIFQTSQMDTHRARHKARKVARKASYVAVGRRIKRLDEKWLQCNVGADDAAESEDDGDRTTLTTTTQDAAAIAHADSEAGISSTGGNDAPIRIGVYDRYSTPLGFLFGGPGGLGAAGGPVAAVGDRLTNRRSDALAMVWLADLKDNVETWVEIPLVVGKSLEILSRNYLAPLSLKTAADGQYYNSSRSKHVPSAVSIAKAVHDNNEDETTGLFGPEITAAHHDFTRIGTLRVKVVVRPGLSDTHASTLKHDAGIGQHAKHAYEVFAHTHPDAVRRRDWRLDLGLPDLGLPDLGLSGLPGLGFGPGGNGRDKGDRSGRSSSLFGGNNTRQTTSATSNAPPPSPSSRWSQRLSHPSRSSFGSIVRRSKGEECRPAVAIAGDGESIREQPANVAAEERVPPAKEAASDFKPPSESGSFSAGKSLKGSIKSAARRLSLRQDKPRVVSDSN